MLMSLDIPLNAFSERQPCHDGSAAVEKISFPVSARRPYWVWKSEFVGLRPNSFLSNLGNFFKPHFPQQENLLIATLNVDVGGLNKVKPMKDIGPVT